LRLFEIAALGDENRGRVPSGDVDCTLVRVSPLRCMARGSRLPLDCCYEQCATRRWWTGWR
jgi:hypothetical protein